MRVNKSQPEGKTITAAMEKHEKSASGVQIGAFKKTPSSTELAAESAFLEMFQLAKSDPAKAVELIPDIYRCMMDLDMSPQLVESFHDNFPFELYFRIAIESTDLELRSLILQCIGESSESKVFPIEMFANPDALGFLLSNSDSLDTVMTNSIFEIISNVVKQSEEARNWVLSAGVMTRVNSLAPNFKSATLTLNMCRVSAPPDPLLPPILEFLQKILDGSEPSIMELGLASVCALLENGASVDPNAFLEYLPPMLLSNDSFIVPWALKILLFVPVLPSEIAEILIQILQEEEKPNIMSVLSKVLARFSEPFRPWSEQISTLLLSKVGKGAFPFPVEVNCIRAAFHFLGNSPDVSLFQLLLRYVSARDITCECIAHLMNMVSRAPESMRGQMLQLLTESASVFEELMADSDERVAAAAEQCLDCIDQA